VIYQCMLLPRSARVDDMRHPAAFRRCGRPDLTMSERRIRLDPTPRNLNRGRPSLAGLDLDAASTPHAVVMSVDTQITTEQVR
jgi:hypothetical protein